MILSCPLGKDELLERGAKLADAMRSRTLMEEKKKAAAAEYKASIDALEMDAALLASEIRTKSEQRPVEVKHDIDYKDGVDRLIRLDTGEIVETRKLRPDEMQHKLAFVPGGDGKPGKKVTVERA